jgi:hypothetical protein
MWGTNTESLDLLTGYSRFATNIEAIFQFGDAQALTLLQARDRRELWATRINMRAKEDQILFEIGRKSVKLKNKSKALDDTENELKYLKRLWFLEYMTALTLSVCGFFFWYYKVQKFQDQILLKKAQTSPSASGEESAPVTEQ